MDTGRPDSMKCDNTDIGCLLDSWAMTHVFLFKLLNAPSLNAFCVWGQGLHTCKAGALPLEPLCQPGFVLGIFKMGSLKLFS
jgi:hypothetical protein